MEDDKKGGQRTRMQATQGATPPMAEASSHTIEDYSRLIVETGEDLFAVLDLEGRRLYNSPSYANLFGDAERLKGTDSFAEIHPDDVDRVTAAFRETVASGRSNRLNYRFVLKNDSIRHIESCGALIRDSQGQPMRVAVVSRDITERMEKQQSMTELAFHDALTQLPNRRLLMDRLNQAMVASKRSRRYGALMFLDLDNFKLLNDTYGHAAGDLLLRQIGPRAGRCLREMDTVARFGGDEFVLVVRELDIDRARSVVQSGIIAEKVRAALIEPYSLQLQWENGTESVIHHQCTTSIGVVPFVSDEASEEEVLSWADKAMYQAKAAGNNQIRFYDTPILATT